MRTMMAIKIILRKLTGGSVRSLIAALKCFKFNVFLCSSSESSSCSTWTEGCLVVIDLFNWPLVVALDEDLRNGQDAIFLPVIFISNSLKNTLIEFTSFRLNEIIQWLKLEFIESGIYLNWSLFSLIYFYTGIY